MNPESLAHSLRKLSISLHGFSGIEDEKFLGMKGDVVPNGGGVKTKSSCCSGTGTGVEEKDGHVSPLPLPEHIIQIIIDIIRQEKEVELMACADEDAAYTHKAIQHAKSFDGDLRSLSLVSRLWTQLAWHALGRKLVLIMDARRLNAVSRAVESPLYGPWTQHVEILEMPYAPTRGKEYVDDIWRKAQQVISRLENVRTLTINSKILAFTSVRMRDTLQNLKSLEEISVINTGVLGMMIPMFDVDVSRLFDFPMPLLQRMTFRRCLPVPLDLTGHPLTLGVRGASDLSVQLSALKPLLFSHLESCFSISTSSFIYEEETNRWLIDQLNISNTASHCGEGCTYEDAFGVCARVRSLRLVAGARNPDPFCTLKVLRNFTQLKEVHLATVDSPTQDIFEALSMRLETAIFAIGSVRTIRECGALDELLFQFCDARRSTLRHVVLSLGEGEPTYCTNLFTSTKVFCHKNGIGFRAICDSAILALC
ncbi:hypothetical protein SCHPADRAFT_88632 [Schizopora paradoxa]|uniref:Uncharacterized protein n=1 Tax=Schizopora paradoxa TaxID=27342 RepID=A0A0H2SBG3_9AGAM|nr:hypothetical protein SCHPADRAFT_88632 [Schizopora paradoxa]